MRIIEAALALNAILFLQLLAQNLAVLEQRVPLNDFFNHRVVGLCDLPRFEHVFRKEDVRRHLRLQTANALTADHVRRRCVPVFDKPVLDTLVTHRAIAMEQVLHDTAPLLFIKTLLVITILRPADAVQLVQHAKLLIQKRALRQHVLALQIRAYPRHALDEVLRAFALVDNAIPVPGRDYRVFHSRLALRPRKTRIIVSIQPCVALGKGPHIIGNAERHQLKQLFALLFQHRIELRLVIQDRFHLLKMKLVVDASVVTGFQTTQKPLVLERVHHIQVTAVAFRSRSRKKLLHFFGEVVV